jgi:hypothetical protein
MVVLVFVSVMVMVLVLVLVLVRYWWRWRWRRKRRRWRRTCAVFGDVLGDLAPPRRRGPVTLRDVQLDLPPRRAPLKGF